MNTDVQLSRIVSWFESSTEWTEMAALCPGVQYGLSTEENFSENKILIFVKFTDSAYGTVQQHLKNQNKFNKNPTIKFLGNEGQLCFPIQQNESKSFKFSMSSTADMEGPGGSFECVQQLGPPRDPLQALGAIPYKIRIHASDDVYEVTRIRMTEAEENHKNKCTREIKPNQTDIGKKVKVKQVPGSTTLPSRYRRDIQLPRDNIAKPSYQPSSVPSKPPVVHSNGLSNGLGNNHVSSTRPKPSMPDIARRPLKERLIHLLALKPYKKPEIIDRLTREGLREKNGVTSVLKQVAFLKDNAYHLNRAMWNDVHENWPFYTESEKQTLKRRKPQNLTPPDSSDGGSSGSGHSPTSTHPGSPPPTITLPKRPGYYDGNDGLPRKRIRISRVPTKFTDHSPYRSPNIENNNSQRRPITDSRDASNMNPRSRESPINDYSNPHVMTTNATTTPPPPATSLLVPNHPSSNTNNNNNHAYGMLNEKSHHQQRHYNNTHNHNNNSDDEDANATLLSSSTVLSTISNTNSITNNLNTNLSTSTTHNTNNSTGNSSNKRPCDSLNGLKYGVSRNENNAYSSASSPSISSKNSSSNNHGKDMINLDPGCGKEPPIEPTLVVTSSASCERNGGSNEPRERTRWSQVSSSTQNHVAQVSPDSQSERISATEAEPPAAMEVHEYPSYLTAYTTIKDPEQRRRYKADFNADYDEYKRLHGVVEKISRRFAELKGKLKQESTSSPKYKDIRKQIVSEYKQNKQDPKHQQTKRRFQYLHDKLSHIKRLVLEYDQCHSNQY
ncbi:hypothetical protein Trydic_g12761 [Trypoxylus dichotomus]